MNFKLYFVREGDRMIVWNDLPESIRQVLHEEMQEVELHLKTPIKQQYEQEAESLMWITSPSGGMMRDESLQQAAWVISFLQPWDTNKLGPFSMAGYASMHPFLANAIYQSARAMVYPSAVSMDFFKKLNPKQESSQEPASTSSESTATSTHQ